MKFLLYNIRYGTGKYLNQPFKHIRGYLSKSNWHLHKIGSLINRYKPDIVGLVEVDLGSFRMKSKNQAAVLARITRNNNVFQYKYEENSRYMKFPMVRKQGNALLLKDKIIRKSFHYLDSGMKKLIIEVETEKVVVFLVHLALGGKTRQKQIVQLYDLVKNASKPVIVAGDFNAFWGHEEITLFLHATELRNVNLKSTPTFPSWKPKKELDFILCSKEIKVNEFKVIQTKLSDHLPLFIDFDVV